MYIAAGSTNDKNSNVFLVFSLHFMDTIPLNSDIRVENGKNIPLLHNWQGDFGIILFL